MIEWIDNFYKEHQGLAWAITVFVGILGLFGVAWVIGAISTIAEFIVGITKEINLPLLIVIIVCVIIAIIIVAISNKEKFDKKAKSNIAQPDFDLTEKKTEIDGHIAEKNTETNQVLIWNVPLSNPNFAGRDQDLMDLNTFFNEKASGSKIQILTGKGGIGKSQLAIEYAYRYKRDYSIVWWIRSEESAILSMDYNFLASELNLPEANDPNQKRVVQAIRSWFEIHQNWLLIFDNAREFPTLDEYIPRFNTGHILITSQNTDWKGIGRVFEISVFDLETSIEFLLKRSKSDDRETAIKLAKELDGLPLALEQAGAYINQTGITLSDYLTRFQKNLMQVMARGGHPGYPHTVVTTWNLSFEAVKEVSSLLILFSFLAPDQIHRWFFEKGVEALCPDLPELVKDPVKFDDAIALLSKYSLINATGNQYSVHRLVQAITRERLEVDKREYWARMGLALIFYIFKYDKYDSSTWKPSSQLISHALAILQHADNYQADHILRALLYQEIGEYFLEHEKYLDAKKCYERGVELMEYLDGPDDVKVSVCLNNLSNSLIYLNDLEGAKTYSERALKINEKAYGPDDPRLTTSLNNLSMIQKRLKDLNGAKANIKRAIDITEKAYGADDPELPHYLSNYAMVLKDLGNLKGAKIYIKRALKIDEKIKGPEHLRVAVDLDYLGEILMGLKDFKGAEKIMKRSVEITEKSLGPEHRLLAGRLRQLGLVQKALRDFKGAETNIKRALDMEERLYGPDHPEIILLRKILEDIYLK